ncbi:MAG: ABC transporter ATP-binding protein, partial [Candidatus Poribacteria bacterium]|nr:ABC transporter ATP-binding protein [Candidatus Poribacteria bacterium]
MNSLSRGDIELQDVRKTYGEVVAVDSVSLTVEDGSFFSLLGPSGCGKTTTLRLLGGFVYPDSGDIRIGGQSVVNLPPNKRDVNTVFQQYALFPHLSVADNIAFGLQMKKVSRDESRKRVGEAMEMVGLAGYEARKPSELSGGQQQRVALARALVNRPSILLLDEPLAALDLKLRKRMQQELKTLQQEVGITFLYVTHDQEEAMALSNRIAVMHEGLVQQVGSPEEIYERPRNRFVADFIGTSNFLEGKIERDEGERVGVTLVSSGEESPHATAWAAKTEGMRVGDRIVASVRPERVLVLDAHGDAPHLNALPGRVVARTFLGT